MNEGVEMVGHKALKVRARVPLSTTLLLTHAGDDTPAPSHTVTRKVRLGGTIRHQVIENILGTADEPPARSRWGCMAARRGWWVRRAAGRRRPGYAGLRRNQPD